MNKHHAKRRRDIKTKLMAAICMLLVSSIMMVSTTYAWFTLSTAPEVTGINTAVGANGNLEMALQPVGGIGDIEESAVGDSMEELDVRNTTWGNLVDLSYAVGNENYYGLDKITLNPSKLNVGADGKLPTTGMLMTPSYGADGRVATLEKNTLTSIYNEGGFPQEEGFGVRAVGTASGMTDRQLDYRNYVGEAKSAISQATNLSKNSLNENGAALANIAITHFVSESETHPVTDVEALLEIVNDLLGVEGTTGVLEYIENAYRALIVAYGASQKGVDAGMDDAKYELFQAAVASAEDLEAAMNELTANSVNLPDGIATPVDELMDTIEAVETAKTELTALLTDDEITWAELTVPMGRLVKVDALTMVCGETSFPVNQAMNNISAIAGSLNNLVLMMPTGGGVYADVADHCGNYDAKVELELDAGAILGGESSIAKVDATMKAQSEKHPGYLSALSKVATDAGSPEGSTGQVMPLSDFYGYVIDLAFRTNAAASDLLLQTEAAGRIYSNQNSTEETMGHGASMTFTTAATGFTLEKMQNLMNAIRVVFFDTTTGEVYGYAKLDMGKTGDENNFTVIGGNTITANLYLYEKTEASVEFVEATHVVDVPASEGVEATYKPADTGATHALIDGKYVEAKFVADSDTANPLGYKEAGAGETATHAMKAVPAGETLIKETADAVIMPLTQNTAHALSVLVYLDGENVTNADVAIDAQSMTGTLNLQFSSSANLVPMNYTPLMNQGATGDNGTNNDAGTGDDAGTDTGDGT